MVSIDIDCDPHQEWIKILSLYDSVLGIKTTGREDRPFGIQSPLPYENPFSSSLYEDFMFIFCDLKIGKHLNTSFQDWLKQDYYLIIKQIETIRRVTFIENERSAWLAHHGNLADYPHRDEYTRSYDKSVTLNFKTE